MVPTSKKGGKERTGEGREGGESREGKGRRQGEGLAPRSLDAPGSIHDFIVLVRIVAAY